MYLIIYTFGTSFVHITPFNVVPVGFYRVSLRFLSSPLLVQTHLVGRLECIRAPYTPCSPYTTQICSNMSCLAWTDYRGGERLSKADANIISFKYLFAMRINKSGKAGSGNPATAITALFIVVFIGCCLVVLIFCYRWCWNIWHRHRPLGCFFFISLPQQFT